MKESKIVPNWAKEKMSAIMEETSNTPKENDKKIAEEIYQDSIEKCAEAWKIAHRKVWSNKIDVVKGAEIIMDAINDYFGKQSETVTNILTEKLIAGLNFTGLN